MDKPALLTKTEVEEYLRISHMTLQNLMKNHGLPFIKLGKRVLFRRSEIEAYLESRTVRAGGRRAS
jgi:excisionase family DNA binding protein